MIGLDTTAIIDLFRLDPSLIKFLRGINDKVALNQISYLELMFGLNFETKSSKIEEEYYNALFNSYPVFGLNNAACKKASKISSDLRKIGKIISPFDCVIAAIFLSNNVTNIITRNKKHFENIKELKILGY